MKRREIISSNIDFLLKRQGEARSEVNIEDVTVCPRCNYSLVPEIMSSFYLVRDDGHHYDLYTLCFCPRCSKVFLCTYIGTASYGSFPNEYDLVSITPKELVEANFSDAIKELSPTFVETYNQSLCAENSQLSQICGPGYRKSLEFLVKDYLCHKYPDEADKIQAEFLGKSIKRIENEKIRILAERSSWIGNDETHYQKKREDLDVSKMKAFIKAILTYIESELAFEEALSISPK